MPRLKAHAEMHEAEAKLRSAREIAMDGAFRNPDGAYGQEVATRDYTLAVQKYFAALKAWVDHVVDSWSFAVIRPLQSYSSW